MQSPTIPNCGSFLGQHHPLILSHSVTNGEVPWIDNFPPHVFLYMLSGYSPNSSLTCSYQRASSSLNPTRADAGAEQFFPRRSVFISMLSQHLPNHLKFPTHCAKPRGGASQTKLWVVPHFQVQHWIVVAHNAIGAIPQSSDLYLEHMQCTHYTVHICWCTMIFCVMLKYICQGVNIVPIVACHN